MLYLLTINIHLNQHTIFYTTLQLNHTTLAYICKLKLIGRVMLCGRREGDRMKKQSPTRENEMVGVLTR